MTVLAEPMIPLRLSRDLLSRRVADILRQQIIGGQILDGSRIVEDDWAEKLGVSRGPVHEALNILERERLVKSTPGKGTYAKALTEESVRQLFAVRMMLEPAAFELAARHLARHPEEAGALRALADQFALAVAQNRSGEFAARDLAIHRRIWELSGNEHLAYVLEQLTAHSAVLVYLETERRAAWRETTPRTHREFIEAVISGDPTVAGECIRQHLALSHQRSWEALSQVLTASAASEPA
jgi:DNA-binding GntR family transcriptional regulator